MTAREDLIKYLTPILRGAFLLDSEAQARAGASRLVERLTYVVDDVDEIDVTSMGKPEREFLRNKWITVKIPNGAERVTLPYDDEPRPVIGVCPACDRPVTSIRDQGSGPTVARQWLPCGCTRIVPVGGDRG